MHDEPLLFWDGYWVRRSVAWKGYSRGVFFKKIKRNLPGNLRTIIDNRSDDLAKQPTEQFDQERLQRFTLERDMQSALRNNIKSLGSCLRIIDDGTERSVKTGFIDITCDDEESKVVVELKAGAADSPAIGQILEYIEDLLVEEEGRKVKWVLVAHDFDDRCKAAARAVPVLVLKKYSIEFKSTE